VTVATACASGATALGIGAEMLRRGEADAVVAGGYDILCRFVMRGFDGLRALTRERVRPFDRRRSGLLLGEGAGLLLLRRDREAGAGRLGTLLGYGSASDARLRDARPAAAASSAPCSRRSRTPGLPRATSTS
jgi:3-oxoacyl-[acyl-carrier-protein] synthase II